MQPDQAAFKVNVVQNIVIGRQTSAYLRMALNYSVEQTPQIWQSFSMALKLFCHRIELGQGAEQIFDVCVLGVAGIKESISSIRNFDKNGRIAVYLLKMENGELHQVTLLSTALD